MKFLGFVFSFFHLSFIKELTEKQAIELVKKGEGQKSHLLNLGNKTFIADMEQEKAVSEIYKVAESHFHAIVLSDGDVLFVSHSGHSH